MTLGFFMNKFMNSMKKIIIITFCYTSSEYRTSIKKDHICSILSQSLLPTSTSPNLWLPLQGFPYNIQLLKESLIHPHFHVQFLFACTSSKACIIANCYSCKCCTLFCMPPYFCVSKQISSTKSKSSTHVG